MASISQGIYVTTADTRGYTLLPNESSLTVAKNVSIVATGTGASHGIFLAGTNQVVDVAGSVYSYHANGIWSDAGQQTITIARDATIFGNRGIDCRSGGNTITNHGTVNSVSDGITVIGAGADIIVNTGAVRSSTGVPIAIVGSATIQNSGLIYSRGNYAISADAAANVTNSGTIQGAVAIGLGTDGDLNNTTGGTVLGTVGVPSVYGAVEGGAGANIVINNGLIQSVATIAVNLGAGHDSYDGHLGRVVGEVRGGDGNDTVLGGAFVDIFRGEADNDTLNGGGGADFLDGGTGNDTFIINRVVDGAIYDTVVEAAGQGTDTVHFTGNAAGQSYTLVANAELLLLGSLATNGTGNDRPNSILGNSATNVLNGRAGLDTLTGGGGGDYFLFNTALSAANKDAIADFNVAADTIRLENGIFTGLVGAANAALSAGQFNINNHSGVALQPDDRIIYDQDHGQLWYDSNGSDAGGTRVNFASTTAYLTLTNADFFIV